MSMIQRLDHIEELESQIGQDILIRERSCRHFCAPVGSDGYYLSFYWCDIKNMKKRDEKVCIYCKKDGLFYLGGNNPCTRFFKEQTEEKEPFEALADFFAELTAEDVDELERMETAVNELELKMLQTEKPLRGVGRRIIEMRRSLMRIKRYYDQLDTVVDELTENENEAIPEDKHKHFAVLSRRVDHLVKYVIDLREYVTQVREAYQAQIDIEQNQVMKIFTVITAIFLPLTLIVGWYGMNFKVPEYNWSMGYLYVIVLSVAVCVLCFWFIKKKKWF